MTLLNKQKAMEIFFGADVQQGSLSNFWKIVGFGPISKYTPFGSYDDIILHINAFTLDDMNRFIDKRLKNNLDASDYMKYLATSYLEFAKTHYALWSTLFKYNSPSEKPLPEWYTKKIKLLFSIIEKSFLSLVKNQKKAQSAAKTLWASIHGICALGLTGKLDTLGAESVQILMDNLIDHYFLGLIHEK